MRTRSPGFDLDALPRHWFGDRPLPTHLVNGVNLLFPAGERFFIRSVRRHLDAIDDPALREQVRVFSGQEAQHARAHERWFARLEEQGYDTASFLRFYERVAYGGLERVAPARLSLATTVALEHFTAVMAENLLRDGVLDEADPAIRDLLAWHAAEEIEHKAVAFDVLQQVDPSYALRMAGLASATACLATFWFLAAASLVRQEKLGARRIAGEWRHLTERHPIGRKVFWRGIRAYIRPGFHPAERDNLGLASAWLESAGIA